MSYIVYHTMAIAFVYHIVTPTLFLKGGGGMDFVKFGTIDGN